MNYTASVEVEVEIEIHNPSVILRCTENHNDEGVPASGDEEGAAT